MTKKKQNNKTSKKVGNNKIYIALAMLSSGGIVALLSLLSVNLGVLGAGFLALAWYEFNEVKKRREWQNKISAKISKIQKDYKDLKASITTPDTLRDMNGDVVDAPMQNDESMPLSSKRPLETIQKKSVQALKKKPAAPKVSNVRAPRGVPANDGVYNEDIMFSDNIVKELIENAIASERIDIFMQPVMTLPHRRAAHYEVFGRIRAQAGVYLAASRYMKLAKENKLMGQIDSLILMQCLKRIQSFESGPNAPRVFLNIEAKTLRDKDFMEKLLGYFANNRDLAKRLVFEMRFDAFQNFDESVRKILDGLAMLGCKFSLDHIKSTGFELDDLVARDVRYLKLDAGLLLTNGKSDTGFKALTNFKEQCERAGLTVIAEKIESEADLRELLDYDIRFGQGFLFGRPDMQGAYERKPLKRRKAFRTSLAARAS